MPVSLRYVPINAACISVPKPRRFELHGCCGLLYPHLRPTKCSTMLIELRNSLVDNKQKAEVNMRRLMLTVAALFGLATVLSAADRQDPGFRTWTDITGKYKVEATFVEFNDGKVQLKKKDGNVITLPKEKLSEDDQQFVNSLTDKESKKEIAASASTTETSSKTASTGQSASLGDRMKASLEVVAGADLKKVMELLDLNPDNVMNAIRVDGLLNGLARPFVLGPNEEFYGTKNKQAFAAAVANISPASLKRAQKLISTGDPALAFGVLLRSSAKFVLDDKFDSTRFNTAFEHISEAQVQKTISLSGEDNAKGTQGMALNLLLEGSARFLDKGGQFDPAAFDTAIDSITAQKIATATEKGDQAGAFDRLLRP